MPETPASVTLTNEGRWYLGSMNDGLFIINTPPRPSTDHQWHGRPDGPTFVVAVSALPEGYAQAIVDAHNTALASQARAGDEAVRALASAMRKLIPDIGEQLQRALDRLEPHQVEALREFEAFLRKE